LKEGREGGIEEGREEERKRELQRLNQILVSSVEANFPSSVSLARKYADAINDPDVLQKVMIQLPTTKDADRAHSYLQAALEEKVL
jgi:hypothetical protein